MDKENRRRSLAQFSDAMSVNASPFNSIKIDVVVVLCGAFMLWLLQDRMPISEMQRIMVFLVYSGTAGTWIAVKVRRIVRQLTVGDHQHVE